MIFVQTSETVALALKRETVALAPASNVIALALTSEVVLLLTNKTQFLEVDLTVLRPVKSTALVIAHKVIYVNGLTIVASSLILQVLQEQSHYQSCHHI